MSKIQNDKIKKFALNLRKKILDMSLVAGADSSHFGGALSIVEIVSVLFSDVMNLKKENPLWDERDRFILSKGHACLAYYAALSEVGYITNKELETFEKNETNLLGHPVINRDLGIEFSNGSLGMGLSLAIGVAIKAVGGSLTGVVSGVSKMGKGIMDAAKNSKGLLKNMVEMAKNKLMGDKIGGQFIKGGGRAPAGARAGITGKGGLLGGLKEKITPGKESKLPSMDKSKDLTKNTKGMDPKKGEGIKGFLKGLGDGLASIGKKFSDVVKGAAAIGIAGLALGGSFALALMMVKDVDPAKMIAFSGSLTMLGLTLALLGKIGSSVIQGALAMGILAAALIPAAFAFSLLGDVDTGKMIAFSIAVPLLGLAAAGLGFLAPFIFAGAAAIAALGLSLLPMAGAFALLGQVDIIGVITSLGEIAAIAPGLALAGIGFASLGAGLMSLGVGALFALPGLAVLAGIASLGSSLQAAGTGVRALAENIGLLKDNLNELEVEKLNELQGLLTTAAIAAPMLALAGGLGQMVAGITGGQSGGNDAVAAKLDELIAVVKEGGDVFIDGSKAGNALVLASSKSS